MDILVSRTSSGIKSPKVEKKRNVYSSSSAEFQEAFQETGTLDHSHAVQTSSFILSVDPLFANLEHPSKQKQAIDAGLSILDELDKLKILLLHGEPSVELLSNLQHIQESVSRISKEEMPFELAYILTEIETRAIVEIAKAKK